MAGSSTPTFGYFSKVALISPTANGRGSMNSATPSCLAATVPAPYFISPCVSVGPSSTTRTFLPWTSSGLSTVTGEAPMMMRAVGSVSYTHLRAHETRHDLVCRLLLEKKKNKQEKNHK